MRESVQPMPGEVGGREVGAEGDRLEARRAALVDRAVEERAEADQRGGGQERPGLAALDRAAGAVADPERGGEGRAAG